MAHAMQVIQETGAMPINRTERAAHFAAHRIVAVFIDDASEGKRIDCVRSMAIGDARLTLTELNSEMDAAAGFADEADKRNGWKAPEGAKGGAKYGPKRSSFNAVSSMIRQLWGAMVHCNACATMTEDGKEIPPKIPDGLGFTKAVQVARGLLREHNIKWDGTPKPTEEQAQAAEAGTALMAAKLKAAKLKPQQAGETIADFEARISKDAEAILAKDSADKREESIAKACEKLIESLGLSDAAEVATRIIAQWEAHVIEEMAKNEQAGVSTQ